MLSQHGVAELYRRAKDEPRALQASLKLQRLRLETSDGSLRIRDLTTAELCLEWVPPRKPTARPSTDPSLHVQDRDSLSVRLTQGEREPS